MAIRFISDSAADLTQEMREAHDIQVAPLGTIFSGKVYLQDVDLTLDAFYEKLQETKELPSTTQVNPEAFAKLFASVAESGDEAIVFCLSAKLSGTYQSACIAKEQFPEAKIYLIDTQTVSVANCLLIRRAAEMREAGASAAEIVAEMEDLRTRARLYAVIDDLKYLHKGGRLSAAGMHVGGILRLKPIVTISDGVVSMATLARGTKNAYQKIAEIVAAEGIDDCCAIGFGHTYAPELMPELEKAIFPHGNPHPTLRQSIGIVVGTHAGPGAVAFVYIRKKV